jgi:hypothetical protein
MLAFGPSTLHCHQCKYIGPGGGGNEPAMTKPASMEPQGTIRNTCAHAHMPPYTKYHTVCCLYGLVLKNHPAHGVNDMRQNGKHTAEPLYISA